MALFNLTVNQGRTAKARTLIEESQPTFAAMKIRREGIASIAHFAESLRQETATAAEGREVLRVHGAAVTWPVIEVDSSYQ